MGSITAFLFYAFGVLLLGSAFFACISRKTVHSVLLLILTFFSASWLFIVMGAEYLAFLLIIIYVGAIAVLFLFVVMMLEEPSVKQPHKYGSFGFLGSFIVAAVIFFQIFAILATLGEGGSKLEAVKTFSIFDIGRVLYTQFFFEFQITGFIFFTAMIGAIMLSMEEGETEAVKRQSIGLQVARQARDCLELTNPEPRKGVKIEGL